MPKKSKPDRPAEAQKINLGNLIVNLENYQVFVDRQPVELTLREFEALLIMAGDLNRIMPYDQLSNSLWKTVDTRSLRNLAVLIHRLRRKLASSAPFVIKTIRGRGYGLIDTRPEAPPRPGIRGGSGKFSAFAAS